MKIDHIPLAPCPGVNVAEAISKAAPWRRDPLAFDAAVSKVAALAAEHADAVDREARFPLEAMEALRREGLLAALIPTDLGGLGMSFSRLASACCTLGQACSATAMIFAMHQIQVACLLRHAASSPWHEALLRHIAVEALLVASVTSEAGVGGQMRISRCAIQQDASSLCVEKHATALSYGARADIFLLTARRNPAAAESDQVLVALDRADITFERTGGWDTLGMRGTCTEAFMLRARAAIEQILPEPFAVIAAETMVPVSHLLWSSLWLGIAIEAVQRARSCLRVGWRKGVAAGQSGLPAGATRLAGAVERLQTLQSLVADAVARFDHPHPLPGATETLEDAARTAALKTSVSEGCLEVVQQALLACGFAGYQNRGQYSLSRQLRDLQSAPLMISNDRIRETTACLLLAQKPVFGLV